MNFRALARYSLLFALLTIAFAAALFAEVGGDRGGLILSDLGLGVGALVASAFAVRATVRDRGRARLAWGLLAGAAFSWAVGEGIWSFYELALGIEVPFPSLADVGYLMAIPLLAASLLSFPSAPSGAVSKLRGLLDGLVAATALLFISWALLIGPLYRASTGSILEKAIGLAYPLGDVVLIAIVIFVAARTTRATRVSLALLGSGVIAIAVADIGFAYLTLIDSYGSGSYIDISWLIGYFLIALSTLQPTPQGPEAAAIPGIPSQVSALVPYVGMLLALALAILLRIRDGELEPLLFGTLFALFALVATRQVLTLTDNLTLTRDLDVKVRERTAELREALSQVTEAKRMQDEFVSNTSHELRTPLTKIQLASRTLVNPSLHVDPNVREVADMIHRAGKRMERLIEDLMLTSGFETLTKVDLQPLDAGSELRRLLEPLRSSGVKVVDQIEGGLCLGDAEYFRIIVDHIINNAQKFGPEDGTIYVRAYSSHGHCVVEIEDEGPGVPPEFRERIFERFFQIDASSTRAHGGVGLGLFITRKLVEAMGGDLELVDAARGSGSIFRVRLPTGRNSPTTASEHHGTEA